MVLTSREDGERRGDGEDDRGVEGARGAGAGGAGGGEEERGGRAREGAAARRGHAGGATGAPADPAHAAAGEAGAPHEARHGAQLLRRREPALPPDPRPRLPALRPAAMPVARGPRRPREPHAPPQNDDDASPRGLELEFAHQRVADDKKTIEEEFAHQRIADDERIAIAGEFSHQRIIADEFLHHKPGLARLNNGSFGSCPRTVLAAQEAWSRWWRRQPDECYFGPLEEALRRAREEVAELICAPAAEVFLLENVTAAASMVAMDLMWSFAEGRFREGDCVLTLNFTYGAVKEAFQAYGARAGARVIQITLPFPVSSQVQILQIFETALQNHHKDHPSSIIRLAVFDHIVSMPTMILPVRDLVALCRRHGVETIFIDGAHGAGNLDLDMAAIDADFYTSNLHKWMFAPTTAAFVHCKAKHLARLHHPIVSHLYGEGIVAECSWVGTRDYSALVAVPEAIRFVKDVAGGVEEYARGNHCKVVAMAEMLASAWGTFLGTPPEMCAAMAMVALPPALSVQSQAELLALRRRIRDEYGVEVHLFFAGNASPDRLEITTYVRISHQIYNTSDEYVQLRDAINDMARKREMLCKELWLRNFLIVSAFQFLLEWKWTRRIKMDLEPGKNVAIVTPLNPLLT